MSRKRRAIALIAACQVAVLALWFSASAVIPSLAVEFALSSLQKSLLTSSVQAGFVVGTLVSAVLGLADRVDVRRLLAVSALSGAIANVGLLWVPMDSAWPVVLRFLTGAAMAGVYPTGMKMIGTWADRDLGLLIGILVGALTLGSAAPHLFHAFGHLDWRPTILIASLCAGAASLAILGVPLGPRLRGAPRFNPHMALAAVSAPGMRLALGGYLGHMWELYAMWAWLGVFLQASFRLDGRGLPTDAETAARLTTFAAIGIGGMVGCVAGGALADRIGRTYLTMTAMALSGTCAVLAGLAFGASPWLLAMICLVWGVTIVADSAQFSASVTELSHPDYVGTTLTVQTCAGFLLTLASIHLVPVIVDGWGWSPAMAMLAIGPVLGVIAMGRLRRRPEASQLAGGRK
ncbi:MAG: MFS transporter [Alphaproteobacteria bacterium]|nr:MFS transporter [Alphaproteobacteria bacterium]